MSTLTQRIPNFLGGISQQPDYLKYPGQLVDSINAFPDYALGLLKRPGGSFVAELYGANTSGRWFSILRDDQEKYVAQYSDNKFRVWNLLDGSVRAVDMASNTGVPGTCNLATLKTRVTDYNAAVALRKTRLTQLNAAQATYAATLDGQLSTKTSLFDVDTTYNGDYEQSITSGVIQNTVTTQYWIKSSGTIIASGIGPIVYPTNYSQGTERTNEYPWLSQQNYRVYELVQTVAAAYTPAQLATALTAMNTAQTNYNTAVSDEASKKALYDTAVSNCNITTVPSNAYLYGAAPEDIELLTLNDYTFVLNKSKIPALKATTVAQLPKQAFVVISVVAYNSSYTINVAGTDFTYQTPGNIGGQNGTYARSGTTITVTLANHGFATGQQVNLDFTTGTATDGKYVVTNTASNTFTVTDTVSGITSGNVSITSPVDSLSIATNLAKLINGTTISGNVYTAVAVGSGIYISTTNNFTIETKGSGAEEGIYVFQDKINTIGKLPFQCKDGYKVKVINSQDIEVDDMWVEFNTTNSQSYGPGVWEESAAPGIAYEIDELTMPHQLTRESDGSFKFSPIVWEDRTVGDDQTNPPSSFFSFTKLNSDGTTTAITGSPIRNIFFYRNRLGFLSQEAVVLSKAGDYFNLFATTAQTVTDDDPIDITATSTKPVTLNYVQNTNTGLVLFGQNEQFLLSNDATDVLSPKTANLNSLSKYEADPKIASIPLGTSLAFISKTDLYTRLIQLARIRSDMPPIPATVTTTVSELIPSTITSMISSPALSIISMGEKGSKTLYQFRFFDSDEERLQSTWYKWELTGNLLDQFFDVSTFYAVVSNGTKALVASFDLTQASEQGYLTLPTGERTDVCLDYFNINPYRTYNSTTNQTTVYLPFDHVTGKTLSVIALGGYINASPTVSSQTVGAVLYPTVQGSSGAFYVVLEGDYRGRDLILGYLYDMTVEIPKIYAGTSDGKQWKADTTASLIVHRLKIETGLSGPITYKVNITGLDQWDNVINVTLPASYVLNNVNLSASATHVVPIHQRNKNLRVRIVGDTPFPVTLSSMQWEGKYNTNFYTRR